MCLVVQELNGGGLLCSAAGLGCLGVEDMRSSVAFSNGETEADLGIEVYGFLPQF